MTFRTTIIIITNKDLYLVHSQRFFLKINQRPLLFQKFLINFLSINNIKFVNKLFIKEIGSVAPLKSLYFHWTSICSSSIVFTPRSLFLLFVLLFSGLIMEDLTTAATSPKEMREN